LRKIVQGAKFLDSSTKKAKVLCQVFPLTVVAGVGTDAPKSICIAAAVPFEFTVGTALFLADIALDISDKIYAEIVDGTNAAYTSGRQESIYENVITNHGNIITTFQATQQLKIMLGEVSDGVKEANEALLDEDRRRRLRDVECTDREGKVPENCTCVDTSLEAGGFSEPGCAKASCQDLTKLCDGIGNNYPYIAELRQGEFF